MHRASRGASTGPNLFRHWPRRIRRPRKILDGMLTPPLLPIRCGPLVGAIAFREGVFQAVNILEPAHRLLRQAPQDDSFKIKRNVPLRRSQRRSRLFSVRGQLVARTPLKRRVARQQKVADRPEAAVVAAGIETPLPGPTRSGGRYAGVPAM
jgi:hypothetical protein